MFIAEFDLTAIRAGVATADKFGSVKPYLLRLQADAEAELANVKIAAESGNAYAAQFCPARAAECYKALAFISLALGYYDFDPDSDVPFAAVTSAA
jgi:hypothetical protein